MLGNGNCGGRVIIYEAGNRMHRGGSGECSGGVLGSWSVDLSAWSVEMGQSIFKIQILCPKHYNPSAENVPLSIGTGMEMGSLCSLCPSINFFSDGRKFSLPGMKMIYLCSGFYRAHKFPRNYQNSREVPRRYEAEIEQPPHTGCNTCTRIPTIPNLEDYQQPLRVSAPH